MYYVIRNSCPPSPNTDLANPLATPNCCRQTRPCLPSHRYWPMQRRMKEFLIARRLRRQWLHVARSASVSDFCASFSWPRVNICPSPHLSTTTPLVMSFDDDVIFSSSSGTTAAKTAGARIPRDFQDFITTVKSFLNTTLCRKKTTQLWNGIARTYTDRFWWYLAVCLLSRNRLSNCKPKITRACCVLQSAVERAFSCSTWDADLCE